MGEILTDEFQQRLPGLIQSVSRAAPKTRYHVRLRVHTGVRRFIGSDNPYWEPILNDITWTVENSRADAEQTIRDLEPEKNPSHIVAWWIEEVAA